MNIHRVNRTLLLSVYSISLAVASPSYADGIEAFSFNDILNAQGAAIRPEGASAEGIQATDQNFVENLGSITTTGSGAEGISVNNFNDVFNAGTVSTTADKADGIDGSDFNNITNAGEVRTEGDFSDGIEGAARFVVNF